jgi:hypothetical protein
MKYALEMTLLLLLIIALSVGGRQKREVSYDTFEGGVTVRASRCVAHFESLGYNIYEAKETDDGYDLIATDRVGQDVIIMVSDNGDKFNYLVENKY